MEVNSMDDGIVMDDLETMVEQWSFLKDAIETATAQLNIIEDALFSHMDNEKAEQIMLYVGDNLVKINIEKRGYVGGQAFDITKLHRLKELLPKEAWDEVYAPEHEKTVKVPAKFNGVKAKKLEKLGKSVKEALDYARNEQKRTLKITEEPYEN
tara:strand:- start:267 stop:728 length:462 start_codon:yes stop_codon:yes gene_type:complete